MSARSTLIFYGVRYDVADEEIVALEERTHLLINIAKQNGLKSYWGNFAIAGEKYFLFIGDQLGSVGIEAKQEIILTLEELTRRAADTHTRLCHAGITEPALLYICSEPDS